MSTAAHQERLMTVIRGPHVSEKSHRAAENNQVVLKVRTDATKREIRQAVELLFEVEVAGVQIASWVNRILHQYQRIGRAAFQEQAPAIEPPAGIALTATVLPAGHGVAVGPFSVVQLGRFRQVD